MKKLLFTLSMVIYLALFSLVSYILTTTCLEYNTSNSIWFMAIYYFIFGIYIIGFIHSGVKAIKKKPKFDRIYITGEDLLKGLGIAIYLGAFAFASYILIRMRMNNLPVFKWVIAYIVVFVLPCLSFIDGEMRKVRTNIYRSAFNSTQEYWDHLKRMAEYSRINRERERKIKKESNYIFSNKEKESENKRLQREYDEWCYYDSAQKQLEDLGNCHRW